MCLLTINNPIQTTEDIVVFKLLSDTGISNIYRSPHQHFRYILGEEYHAEIEKGDQVFGSLISWDFLDLYEAEEYIRIMRMPVTEHRFGIHFFYPERISKMDDTEDGFVVGKFIIPAGSTIVNGFAQTGITTRARFVDIMTWEAALEYLREGDALPSDSLSHISEPE